MDRRQVLALSGALAAAALSGCLAGTGGPAGDDDADDDTGGSDDDGLPGSSPGVDDEQLAALAAGNAAFALDVHQHVTRDEPGNLFLSPYSISVALAMTFAGARGETREQMADTLHYTLGDDLHPAFAALQTALAERATTIDELEDEEIQAFELAVANALWGQDGFPFDQAYLDLLNDYYGAGLESADFAGDPDGERERINEWVEDHTNDRIQDLLPDGSITPQTVLVLTNAIYFLAGWLHQFDPADTQNARFTNLDGEQVSVPFMHQSLRTNYANLTNAQAIELPYVGNEVSMVLILPDEGRFEEFEQNLTPETLFGIFEELSDHTGELALPVFEFESEIQLADALRDLGMPLAFEAGADFSGMVEGDGSPIWIDEVYHKAFVKIDEEGTEAAAATAVVMPTSAPPDWGELRFHRPFLFAIRDKPTNAILFLGRVTDL